MGDLDQVLQILDAVHEASIDPCGWQKALALVGKLLNCDGIALGVEDEKRGFTDLHECGSDPEAQQAYLQEFHTIDPVIAVVRQAPAGSVFTEAMAIAREELDRSRFYADFAARFGYHHCIQAFTHRTESASGLLGAARAARRGAFTREECALLARLIPHFQQALRVRAMLREAELQRDCAFSALDGVKDGIVVVDEGSDVVFANTEARRLLRDRSGVRQVGTRLVATRASDQARLLKAVGEAAREETIGRSPSASSAFRIAREPPARGLLVQVVPIGTGLAERSAGLPAGAMVFISDPDATPFDPGLIAALLGLTATEAEVAGLLASGLTLDDISSRLSISRSTARTHLRHIYTKTQVSQQSQLVALVSTIPRRAVDGPRSVSACSAATTIDGQRGDLRRGA